MSRASDTRRPGLVVLVAGTGTGIGKTWLSNRMLRTWRADDMSVAARKPAQSFDPGDDLAGVTDAQVLAAASGEDAAVVCCAHRWYEVAMAPPMAAEVLGRPSFGITDLLSELTWPAVRVDVGLVETAGGVRSPLAADGDTITFGLGVRPEIAVLVADSGLGTINAVRLSAEALGPITAAPGRLAVFLNRFDPDTDLHCRNRDWLIANGFTCATDADAFARSLLASQGAENT